MPRNLFCGVLCLFAVWALAIADAREACAMRRVALVIGNAKYEHAGLLSNTINDSHAIAALLKRAKFDLVDERDDLGVVAMKRAVRDFANVAADADVAVIYYSGHGIEAAGVNYLIPVDAKLANAYDVEDETLPLERLQWATSRVRKLSLIILDACRENPFLRGTDGATLTHGIAGQPLAEQPIAANTLIAYAAKAGSLSYDGAGANSPFTTALVKYIAQPGVDIRIALGQVRDDVLESTGRRQEPYVYGSLGGETVSLTPAAAPVADPLAATAADYAMAERVGSADAWRAFIAAHREGGYYVDLARAQLDRAAPPAPQPAPTPAPSAVAALPPPKTGCEAETERLAALRGDPEPAAIAAFASGMTCAALRPQLNRLMESAGLAAPAPPPAIHLASRNPEAGGCDGEGRELERLRAEPDLARAQTLAGRLTCAALKPQLQRLLESLGAPPSPATGSQRAMPAPVVANPCPPETAKLAQLRAQPDRDAARAFAESMRCAALKPQVTRLLESLGD